MPTQYRLAAIMNARKNSSDSQRNPNRPAPHSNRLNTTANSNHPSNSTPVATKKNDGGPHDATIGLTLLALGLGSFSLLICISLLIRYCKRNTTSFASTLSPRSSPGFFEHASQQKSYGTDETKDPIARVAINRSSSPQ